MAFPLEPVGNSDLQYHFDTYHAFVRWAVIAAAHALLVLVLLDYFFA